MNEKAKSWLYFSIGVPLLFIGSIIVYIATFFAYMDILGSTFSVRIVFAFLVTVAFLYWVLRYFTASKAWRFFGAIALALVDLILLTTLTLLQQMECGKWFEHSPTVFQCFGFFYEHTSITNLIKVYFDLWLGRI